MNKETKEFKEFYHEMDMKEIILNMFGADSDYLFDLEEDYEKLQTILYPSEL